MAIILLTVAIRVLLLPLTWKQTKSMAELQRIQPKIKELQQKYKDDKEKLQEETLKFYQENKVNPLGGCLPMLIQMPILFALYGVLGQHTTKGKIVLGPMLQYLADHHTVGTFYRIIPDIAKTPQSVWASHDYLTLIPYLVLVLVVRREHVASAGVDARGQATEEHRRGHGRRHVGIWLGGSRRRAALLGCLQHLGCRTAADHDEQHEAGTCCERGARWVEQEEGLPCPGGGC